MSNEILPILPDWLKSMTQMAAVGSRSPLADFTDVHDAHYIHLSEMLVIAQRAALELVVVRGEGADRAFQEALTAHAGVSAPILANTVHYGEKFSVAWMGPDEWLVRSDRPSLNPSGLSLMEDALSTALEGMFAGAVDVSSGYTTLYLSGSGAVDAMSRGCPLDLHESVFLRPSCAQSHYFKAPVLIYAVGNDSFEIVIRRSFAEYITLMLRDSANTLLAQSRR
ncbi:sarcosine oxidase subunit gamma [Caballeronia sp. DA-9]|uniref:sarcosine oxidase subunit gamma n=1 Tax=Caballeronia sp. DA-9 TaxID=3436237 RepID=UPI003F67B0DF